MTAPVLLVGAGPGDPDLLTLRAEAALGAARTVVTDADLAPLAAACAPGATTVVAGDDPERTAARLAERHHAAGGAPAVRLYRGDPWLHPRFAAEAAALAAAGVAHAAVPGPVAPLALAAAAGLAAHHRPRAVTVTLAPPTALPPALDPARTLVAEVDDLRAAARHLAATGEADLAAAAVPDAGPPRRATLAGLAAAAPPAPGVIVVGAVAE